MTARSWVASIVVCAAVVTGGGRAVSSAPLDSAFELYDRGAFDEALHTFPPKTTTAGEYIDAASRWIGEAPDARRPRRRMVAAALAAELVWATFDAADHADANRTVGGRFNSMGIISGGHPPAQWPIDSQIATLPLLAWACTLMPASGDVSATERWWWLSSTAIYEEARHWNLLVGSQHTNVSGVGISRETTEGHLVHARRRLPDEPRWRLAEAIARAALLYVHGRSGGRPDLLRNREATNAGDERKLLDAERAFEPLVAVAGLAGEAELRIAQLELRRRQWSSALAHLDRARPLVDGQALLPAATDFFAGWAFEQLGRNADAVAAYRRAHEREPRLRQVATLFAGQLFVAHERAEAYAVLSQAFATEPEPLDIVAELERGDGRFLPEYIRRLREALR